MEKAERRYHHRKPLIADARIIPPKGAAISCMLQNVSAGGAMVVVDKDVELPPQFLFEVPGNFTVSRRCKLAWRDGIYAGMEFLDDDRSRRRPAMFTPITG